MAMSNWITLASSAAWGSGPSITAKFEYRYERSGANMRYQVRVTINTLPYSSSYFGYPIYTTIKLDGVTKVSGHTLKSASPSQWSSAIVYTTDTLTVSNKTTGSTSLSIRLYSGSGEDRDKTYSYSLTVAPAASSIDSASNSSTGSAVSIKWTPRNSTFTYSLSFAIGSSVIKSVTGISPGSTAQYTYTGYTPAHSVIPNATSATVKVTLDTYSGSTKVGSATKSFTLSVPASVTPEISSLTVTAANDEAALGQAFAVSLSRAQWACEAVPGDGATIKSYAFNFATLTGAASSGTTGVLPSAGSFTPSITVTDSRGRKDTFTGDPITVHPYAFPVIPTAAAERCNDAGTADESGTRVAVLLSATCSPIGGINSVTLRARSRATGGLWSDYTSLTQEVRQLLSEVFSAQASYQVELSAVDALNNETVVQITIPTAEVTLHLRDGGKGAAFGKYAEKEALECAWDAYFDKNVQVDGDVSGARLRSTAHSDLGATPESYPVFHDGWLYSRTLAEMRADLAAYETVPLTVVSDRLTDLNYTARYYPMLGMCFVRIYGKINADLNTGYDYDLLNIGGRLPAYNAALAVKCGKNAMAAAYASGVVSLRPMGENISASSGWAVYIAGFWFA